MIPKGKLLIIGGAEDKGEGSLPIEVYNSQFVQMEILKKLVAPNQLDARIEVITTASDEPEEVQKTYEKAFKRAGYKNVGFMNIQDKMEARQKDYSERVNKAHTILFSGGDQFKIATILGGSPLIDAIRDRYHNDKRFIVAGTSAGAMALSKIMIQGGGVHEALFDSDLKTSSGIGLLENCIIDTHFIRRGRFGRLAHAVIVNPGQLGIGLGEDAALMIKKGYEAECLGSGMVVIIDGQHIRQTNVTTAAGHDPIYVEKLLVHLLVKGCSFDIRDLKMWYSPPKK